MPAKRESDVRPPGVTAEDDDLRRRLEQRSTDELVSILRNRDEEEWRPEVFDIVASILAARGLPPAEVVALGPEGIDVLESQPLLTVGRYFSPIEAHAHRLALEQGGIRAWVSDEILGTSYGLGVGARLQVRAEDEASARSVLEAGPAPASALPADIAEEQCPKCGSTEVTQAARIGGSQMPAEGAHREWHCKCGACGNEWSAE